METFSAGVWGVRWGSSVTCTVFLPRAALCALQEDVLGTSYRCRFTVDPLV